MKRILLILIASTAMLPAIAQKKLTLRQLIPGNPDYLYAKSLVGVRWADDGTLEYTHPDSAATARPRPKQGPGVASADGAWRAVGGESLESVKAGKYGGNRLFLINTNDSTDVREVSDDSQGDIVWGQAVHRNEFGIDGGLFWSPEGHRLAFYRMDETMVQAYPLVNTDAREAEVTWVKYPMAGMTSHQVTLGVYDPDTRRTVYLSTLRADGPDDDIERAPEHYLTCVTWQPDGRRLYVAELNRRQNHLKLNAYDAESGAYVGTLFEETDAKYVEPEHPLFFLPGAGNQFVWQSERDGWNHLYLCKVADAKGDAKGKAGIRLATTPVQLTRGEWQVTDIVGADAKGKTIFFYATKDCPIEQNLFAVDVKTRRVRRLTVEPGWHHVILNAAGTEFYDTYSSHSTPRVCQRVDIKTGRRTVLYTAPDPYDGYDFPEVSVGTIKAADGETDLYYRLTKPTDFDPTQRYPAVVYLYNGPHAQMVTEGYKWGGRGWDIHMANLGYVVFTIDGRGSEHRGLAFEQAIWHRLGVVESQDQMEGIKWLASHAWVDTTRIGIHGWSYGGFMTTYMMLHHPETFKAGVAGGPVLDWSRYEVMYGERYMGTPDDNAEGYAANRLVDQAGELRGCLLIIHDDQDATVVPQHTVQFLKNAVRSGTHPDLFVYPGHEHNVRGVDRVHLHEHITRYFEDHLR